MTKKKAPPKKRAVRTARRTRLAAKVVAGQKMAAIAAEEGISREYASREVHSEQTQALIADMMDACTVRALKLLHTALDVVEASYKAKRFVVVDKKLKDAGADHFARLAGVQRFTALMLAGRVVKAEEKKQDHGPITIQVIEAAIKANQEAAL